MSIPTRLYKFVAPDRVDILENGLIRFTQPSALNDPFEFRPLFDQMISENGLRETLSSARELIGDQLRQKYAALTSTERAKLPPVEDVIKGLRANPAVVDRLIAQQEPLLRAALTAFTPQAKEVLTREIGKRLGILSLSEHLSHQLLWAHYADSHRGFVLEFDTSHPYFDRRRSNKDELYHLRRVMYAQRTSRGRTLMDITGEDLLSTKRPEWSYETEWRMFIQLSDADRVINVEGDEIYLFAMPLSALTKVVVGARSSEELVSRVKTAISRPEAQHVMLLKATLDLERETISVGAT